MEVLERQVATKSKTILIRALRPKTQLPATAMPCEDRTGRLYTGQGKKGYFELLTPQEKAELPFIIDHNTKVVLVDGKVLDLDNEMDAANWKWLQKHPYLALSKELALASSRTATYYVEDRVLEAKRRVRETELVDKARSAVRGISYEKLVHTAKILGLVTANAMEEEEVLDWVLGQANVLPKTVLEAVNPENAERSNAKIFFNELIKYKVLVRQSSGAYTMGEDAAGLSVGHTPEIVIDWMLSADNAEMVKLLRAKLIEVKGK